jgi:serine/threonine protein kinase
MDFSLLADRRAPWHGHQGYVGTDNYRSPEHLTRGSVPGLPSDVFTCGLMLHELLAGRHPYWSEDQGDYAKLVLAHAAEPPALVGLMPPPASNAEVSATLHRCLRPTPPPGRPPPSCAPSSAVVAPSRPSSPSRPRASRPPRARREPRRPLPRWPLPRPAGGEPIVADGIELVGPEGRSLRIGVRTELGKALMRQFGPDGEYWDHRQCVLERDAGRRWVVSPVGKTMNETLVNGEALAAPRVLRQAT